MSAFLKIDSTTTPPSQKEVTGAEYDYAVNVVLSLFANSSSGVGTLSVNPADTTGLTLIGSFVDTYYNANTGEHPIGTTVTSVTYNFYQNRQSVSETLTRPVEYSSGAIREQSDASLNADLISTALANLVSLGVGSYVLSPTTPVGGTWSAVTTVRNSIDATDTNDNVTTLWRKTAPASAPTTIRPCKINPTTPVSIKEMSDAEIQSLISRLRNRIVATGIGTYAVQASAPVSGGTWITAGSSFSDTRRTQSDLSYTGTYAGTYAGTYSGAFSGSYAGSYSGSYTGSYAGTYGRQRDVAYAGTYARYRTVGYVGSYTRLRQDFYRGFVRANYTGYYAGQYNTTYTGAYTGYYTASYFGAYTGYYAGSYAGTYSGAFAGTYSKAFSGSYTGNYSGAYSGITLNAATTSISNVSLWVRTA